MTPLFVAVTLSSLVAAAFGLLLGLCIAFAKAGADPVAHPVLGMLLRHRNPIINMVGALVAWGVVLYLIPKSTLLLFGVGESEALALSMVVQFCVISVFLLVGERVWKHVN